MVNCTDYDNAAQAIVLRRQLNNILGEIRQLELAILRSYPTFISEQLKIRLEDMLDQKDAILTELHKIGATP